MKEMNIEGTVDYATALQNIANAHRAAGLLEESLNYYMETFAIYEENIEPGDYRFASLNNNIALLYQEMGNYEKATQYLKKALAIIEKIPGAEIEVATTLSNLGASLLEIEEIQEAEELKKDVQFGFWEKADDSHTVVRFATSWATRMEDVQKLLSLL